MKKVLIIIFLVFLFCSCGINYKQARQIIKNPKKDYTGIDTIIRINGYYYNQRIDGIHYPFFLKTNGEFLIYKYNLNSKKKFEEDVFTFNIPDKGYYDISNDTLKIIYAGKFQIFSYDIYSINFIILNDSTLKAISFSANGGEIELLDKIFEFQEFNIEKLSNK
ncbi:MAG: hypothetical protein LBP67_04790 [Bacteroidales bacterium]|jgi:hypothetical protein|nr:hypothetical protein [Bacteroidales bacterium]